MLVHGNGIDCHPWHTLHHEMDIIADDNYCRCILGNEKQPKKDAACCDDDSIHFRIVFFSSVWLEQKNTLVRAVVVWANSSCLGVDREGNESSTAHVKSKVTWFILLHKAPCIEPDQSYGPDQVSHLDPHRLHLL